MAFNPTVEPGRATRAGKHPAVVATNVGELAIKAVKAREELGAIIEQLNGIADRILFEVSGEAVAASIGTRRASQKLREMTVRLQRVCTALGLRRSDE
jgi:hypothetical protein